MDRPELVRHRERRAMEYQPDGQPVLQAVLPPVVQPNVIRLRTPVGDDGEPLPREPTKETTPVPSREPSVNIGRSPAPSLADDDSVLASVEFGAEDEEDEPGRFSVPLVGLAELFPSYCYSQSVEAE